MTLRRVAWGRSFLLAGALAMTVGGCSGQDTPGTAPSLPSPSASALQRFDPPVAFDAAAGVALPTAQSPMDLHPLAPSAENHGPAADRITLAEQVIYTSGGGKLSAVSAVTGQTTWTLTPQSHSTGSGNAGAPLSATVGGRPAVLAAFPTTVAGQGTTPDGPGMTLVAADTATGRALFQDVLALPDLGSDAVLWQKFTATVLGADEHTLTIGIDRDSSGGAALVADAATHRIRWFRRGFTPDLVTGGSADGLVIGDGKALSVRDQTTAWTYDGDHAAMAGPGLIAVTANSGDGVRVLTTAGKPAPGWPASIPHTSTCVYDQASVTLCHGDAHMMAFQTATGRRLWALPATGRIAPDLTAAWHGALYGDVDGRPVVLDARTGLDRETSPGIQPLSVGPYGAIAIDAEDRPYFYPAVR